MLGPPVSVINKGNLPQACRQVSVIWQSLSWVSSQVTLGCVKLTTKVTGNRWLCAWLEKEGPRHSRCLRQPLTSCVRSGESPNFSELLFLFSGNGDHPMEWFTLSKTKLSCSLSYAMGQRRESEKERWVVISTEVHYMLIIYELP